MESQPQNPELRDAFQNAYFFFRQFEKKSRFH